MVSRPPEEDHRSHDDLKALADRVSALEAEVQRLAGALGEPPAEEPPPAPEVELAETAVEGEPPAAPAPEPARPYEPWRPRERARWDWARFERVAGRQWMVWVGVLALFLATGFFVKYAMDRGWLGPLPRVVLGILAGAAMVAGGHVSVRRRLPALGQGLMGGGVAILYLSLYASFTMYHLVPQAAAFAGMVLVTAGGLALAVLHDAMALSFLALLGGLLTPVLLSTGTDARDALFSYLLLLDLGTLGVALFKRWRGLDVMAFAGTVALYAAWFVGFYSEAALGPALVWLGAFYVVFLVLPFTYHFRRGRPIAVEGFVMALANATFVLLFANQMLGQTREHSLGLICLVMAACYTVLGRQTRRRIPADERALFGFAALAVLCLTLSVPLYLKLKGITVTWAAEGPALLYLGYLCGYGPLRAFGFAVLALALGRLLLLDPLVHRVAFGLIANRTFLAAMSVPAAGAAFALIHERWRGAGTQSDRVLKLFSGIGAGLVALGLLHAELWQWFQLNGREEAGRSVVVLLWAAGAVGFLLAGLWLRSEPCRMAALAPVFMALLLGPWQFLGTPRMLVLNLRFGTAMATVLTVFGCMLLLRYSERATRPADRSMAAGLQWVGLGFLLLFLSSEPYKYWKATVYDPERARWLALTSVSIVWAVYAAAVLGIGFWRRSLALRLAALALFGATALKLVFVDIAHVERIYRAVAFLVLGLLMIGGAYLYNRIERRLEGELEPVPEVSETDA